MMLELWDLVSRNLIDWSDDQHEVALAVQAYADAGELGAIMLLVHEQRDEGAKSHTLTGNELRSWLQSTQTEVRQAS